MSSSTQHAKILLIDDDRGALDSLADVLEHKGYEVIKKTDGAEGIRVLKEQSLDLVITDLRMGEVDGMKVLAEARAIEPPISVIVMTAFARMETAVEAIRKGASDYLSRPFRLEQLDMVVRRTLEQAALQKENRKLRSIIEESQSRTEIIGSSPEMVEVYKIVARVAPLNTTVLIQGESGTGKELVAQSIHKNSGRKGLFVAVNCAAFSESLLESEIFGYVKGAFTGATGNKKGVFEAASGGTCFLDEISNTPLSLQMKLLRVLEEHEVTRVGSTEPIPVNVRIIAATNRLLEEMVQEEQFREDLFYRLKVVTIDLPPLRSRKGDIAALLDHFVLRFAAASGKTIAVHESVYPMLVRYDWPGNVRELENALERAIALNSTGLLTPEDFPDEIRNAEASMSLSPQAAGRAPQPVESYLPLSEIEKNYVLEVLEASEGNVSKAADILSIDRRTVYRILERHGIQRS